MKSAPDHHDAELVLKMYDLRRESVMRKSRAIMTGEFWPKTYEEFFEITQPAHDYNAAFRQVSSYWEMVYSFARHGIMNPDFLVENAGEGVFIYAKVAPFIERFRKEVSPTAFANVEWITKNCEVGRTRFELAQKRVRAMMEGR